MTDPGSDDGRDDFVLQERLSGRSARSISKELRCIVGEVNAALDRVLPTLDNAARLRHISLDLHRLDGLLETFSKRAIEKADTQARLCVVKILDRKAALLGLDSPTRVDVVQLQATKEPSSFERIQAAIMRVKYGPDWRPGDSSDDDPAAGNGSDPATGNGRRSVVSKRLLQFGIIGPVKSGFFRLRRAYARRLVSARQHHRPTTDNQERELRAAAERMGHDAVEVYADNGISGAMGRDKRPAFDRLHRDAARRNNMAILYEARGESGSGLPNAVRRYLTIIPDFASLIRATRITTRYHFRSFV